MSQVEREESAYTDEQRAALERLAETESPGAWVARALLDLDE